MYSALHMHSRVHGSPFTYMYMYLFGLIVSATMYRSMQLLIASLKQTPTLCIRPGKERFLLNKGTGVRIVRVLTAKLLTGDRV